VNEKVRNHLFERGRAERKKERMGMADQLYKRVAKRYAKSMGSVNGRVRPGRKTERMGIVTHPTALDKTCNFALIDSVLYSKWIGILLRAGIDVGDIEVGDCLKVYRWLYDACVCCVVGCVWRRTDDLHEMTTR
jgi:hypothetical protein